MKRIETPGDRAFRHEREQYLLSLVKYAVAGLMVTLVILFSSSMPTSEKFLRFVLAVVLEVVVFALINAGMKWHQNKYGGD